MASRSRSNGTEDDTADSDNPAEVSASTDLAEIQTVDPKSPEVSAVAQAANARARQPD